MQELLLSYLYMLAVVIMATWLVTILFGRWAFKDDSFRDHVIGGISLHAFTMMVVTVFTIIIARLMR